MTNSMQLELINGAWAIVSLWLVFMMVRYFMINLYEGGWERPSVQLSKGLALLFFGEAVTRGWVWYARAAHRDGAETAWMFTSTWLILFSLVALAGAICTARVVSPERWGHWRWGMPTIMAVAMVLWSWLGIQG
jgi:hypothetical protein